MTTATLTRPGPPADAHRALGAYQTLCSALPGTEVCVELPSGGADAGLLRLLRAARVRVDVPDVVTARVCVDGGVRTGDLVLADARAGRDELAGLAALGVRRTVVRDVGGVIRLAAACAGDDAAVLAEVSGRCGDGADDAVDALLLADQLGMTTLGVRVPLTWADPGVWVQELTTARAVLSELLTFRVAPHVVDLGSGFPVLSEEEPDVWRQGRLLRRAVTTVFGPRPPRTAVSSTLPPAILGSVTWFGSAVG
ncbi:hypothetical protein [Ornithinimicrobium tianjinense]|uniref:Uncharacterized protein n=1 Tax=Ornithinimicrobium tianjinense TaxID=1195761 RepID=A0A917F8H1_9MICO|nr:hypothetical protein [Ornithinimicrobium tianjinense]GGF57806.1 hypothetical protein GCM10011366_26980 [Ornithinimicrobium tianjinense]